MLGVGESIGGARHRVVGLGLEHIVIGGNGGPFAIAMAPE